ncbi:MAG: helix-turn-helix domain-containing protein [Bifidobacteriaceae bacterium]|jgi:excisionase family DNA binding protein|nr:helix-turn-helix domain-containing protein [Bifidobacteriaceae bacterium]
MVDFKNRRFVGTTEACKILGVSRSTLLSYMYDGTLRAYHIKKRNSLRFDINDLEDLLVSVPYGM